MKFIYSDCLDYIDPCYDFINDRNGDGRGMYWDDLFAHEYMDHPPYDGILVSRGVVGDRRCKGKYSDSQAMRFRREGARKFLRYPEDRYPGTQIFGDCGAFQYANLSEPPYSPEDMIEFYGDGRFTHGCSIDHIIFYFNPTLDERRLFDPRIPEDVKKRYEITLDLAEKFIKLSPQLGSDFTPIGVVQGWSPMSMARAAQSLVGMGYDYLAIGGLVPLRAADIHKILAAVRDMIPEKIRIHLLGFAKADNLSEFFKFNISSFDTSSPMIRAFKDGRRNYYLPDENGSIRYFQAIRIPQALENNTLKNKVKTGKIKQEELLSSESKALASIRSFAGSKSGIEDTLEALRNYSKFLFAKDENSKERNHSILDAPDERVSPDPDGTSLGILSLRVCRDSGVEVIIFRSSNRNKRRGMHNLGVFYDQLEKLRNRGTNG